MAITYACYNKGCLEDFLENIGFSSKLWKNTQSITMGSFIADQFKDQKNELIKSVLDAYDGFHYKQVYEMYLKFINFLCFLLFSLTIIISFFK